MKYDDKRLLRMRITGCPKDGDEAVEDLKDDLEEEYADIYEADTLALGTWIGCGHQVFDVIIHYRDPRAGELTPPRSWCLEVSAMNRQDAKRVATKDFRLVESLSSGPWQREILAIEVIGEDGSEFANPEQSPHLS